MWKDAATTSNVKALRARGYFVMEPEVGRLTGSDVGQGRFPEVGSIVTSFKGFLGDKFDLEGKKVLITAGGTREAIDPVRYIGNRSSGKQGVAIAKAAFSRGAKVTLILANSDEVIGPGIEVVRVETAAQMGAAVESMFAGTDLLFMAAAVADARPTNLSQKKIKKDNLSSISLVENPDILKALSAIKGKQIICAFAAETNSDVSAAGQKMRDKGADLIYLNDVSEGQIFGSEQTSGHIIDANGLHASYRDITKDTLAHHLLDTAVDKLS
jgi:phosphopantothenoylcysteine decarboxylase/phosphopantothenate--cysteine ligase